VESRNKQHQTILSGWRPNGADRDDPIFDEALEAVNQDAVLAQWFESEQQFDTQASDAVCSEPVPSDLRARILETAGGESSRALPGRHRYFGALLALAAAIVLGCGAYMVMRPFQPAQVPLIVFVENAVRMSETDDIALQKLSGDPSELQSWLTSAGAIGDFEIPAALAQRPGFGCQSLRIDGRPASLICFQREDGGVVHLFVMEEGEVKDAPPGSPQFVQEGNSLAATWSSGGRTFVLTGPDLDKSELMHLILG